VSIVRTSGGVEMELIEMPAWAGLWASCVLAWNADASGKMQVDLLFWLKRLSESDDPIAREEADIMKVLMTTDDERVKEAIYAYCANERRPGSCRWCGARTEGLSDYLDHQWPGH
jgi:hypothetical protein